MSKVYAENYHDAGHIVIHGAVDVRTDGWWRHGYKTKISRIDGLPHFQTVVLRARRRLARSSATTRGNCKKNYHRSLAAQRQEKEPMQSILSHDATIFASQGTPPAVENRSIQGRDDEKTQVIKHFLGICAGQKVNIRDSGGLPTYFPC